MLFNRIVRRIGAGRYDSAAAYARHLDSKLRLHPTDRDLAFATAIGSETVRWFRKQGNAQVAVLKHHGLRDGMTIYDLGCGCGRTAQALKRNGWQGRYIGADIVDGFIAELKRQCPEYEVHVHREPTIVADDHSLDMLFHWSVFTHISPEECFLYLEDSFRALKPGGHLVFSFLEMSDPNHWPVFESRLERLRAGKTLKLLDTYLSRDCIEAWAERIGFGGVSFTDGQSTEHHPKMWQTVAAMTRPAVSRAL
jgi:ubiquinone/menaquinone biosynthesis C-methylase UbiE